MLRERIITLEEHIKHLTSMKALDEATHKQEIASLQERINGMLV